MVFWPRTFPIAALLVACTPAIHAASFFVRDTSSGLSVDTTSGTVQGFYNDTAHDVRAFLGVPFAAAPTGSLRFMPPAKRARSSSVIKATSWPAACPGTYANANATNIGTLLPYLPFTKFGEDCLTMNVWTPSIERLKKNGNKLLPVLIYIYGGSFEQGATSASVHEGTDLVAKHDVVFLAINYRLTIFGNANSPYLATKAGSQNVGLLDQRFALEWLQQNVAAFGGDPKRMIALGQSAGSISAAFFSYAYPKDPIITGIGALSASPLLPLPIILVPEIAQGNFTNVASAVGCNTSATSDKQIFQCMQKVPFQTLVDEIVDHPEKNYLFRLTVDNITAITDVAGRIASGNVAKLPQFMGTVENEGDSLVPFSFDGIDEAASAYFTSAIIQCPVSREAKLRIDGGLPTWRYRYSGIYSNLSPWSFIRTYHTSDVPMWLGSINVVPGLKENVTDAQRKQSDYMEEALVAFANDPQQGLTKFGWPKYQGTTGKTLVHLDPRNSSKLVVLENPTEFDAPCDST
ncbi:alpha/beta-hydrolase [Ceratobasidium sp. AG-I]|nr:alpha/beta-hydrolase [Ceratobasidium sp. AG-I]